MLQHLSFTKWVQLSTRSPFLFFLFLFFGSTNTTFAEDLKILKMGLGTGSITSTPGGINCGMDCDGTYALGTSVTLTASPAAGSVFAGWEGDATGVATSITVTMNTDLDIRAVFNLAAPIPQMTDFSPSGIQMYLAANPDVNTPALFLAALPTDFKQNWILLSRSESLQTGTAKYPRLLLPNEDATVVFTIGMVTHSSYPGSHPNAIECMQWDAADKNFRFHEIVLAAIPAMGSVPARSRMISIDDSKCSKCHSTRNVLNSSSSPGTTGFPIGLVKVKNKPNWDSYDSWGGMLPFNRDRIYQGTVEAAAFRSLFNLWNWRNGIENDLIRQMIEQLELQPPHVLPSSPHSIIRDLDETADIDHIKFGFDGLPPIAVTSTSSDYSFGAASAPTSSYNQGGRYVTLRHSNPMPTPNNDTYGNPGSDEGRGVQLFDLLGGLDGNINCQRVADELVTHAFATGSFPIDIRPIALAITKNNLLQVNSATNTVQTVGPLPALTIDLSFFDSRNGMNISDLINDTRTRTESMPKRKADIQKINLDRTGDIYSVSPTDGLIQEFGAATAAGTSTATSRIRQDVFQRPIDLGAPDATVMGGKMVDREAYFINTQKIALYRYFLEPLEVAVDKWSMGVRGRSRTYSFADVFGAYLNVIEPTLVNSLQTNPPAGFSSTFDPNNSTELINAVNSTLATLPAVNEVPKFTNVQRIFNKSCIECHGGLDYPPYSNYSSFLDFSENENPSGVEQRLDRSYNRATAVTTNDPATSSLYNRLVSTSEDCPFGMMPCGGPALSKTDIETIRRWIVGARPYTHGDPHIRTIDGINYDFQAAGEFVLLRGVGLEIQTRQTAVETSAPLGPNSHTGLTSCVSVNTAVAIKLGSNRITYQPQLNGAADPEGLHLRVNGKRVQLGAAGIPLGSGDRIMPTSAPGGVQIEAAGGTVIVLTPGWWNHYQLWYLNIDARHVRATEGLMGQVAAGNWLPAMPDGSLLGPKPDGLGQRYEILYYVFGEAWRVNNDNTLFDYAPGTSTEDFSLVQWPNGNQPDSCKLPQGQEPIKPPMKLVDLKKATLLCGDIQDPDRKANCIQDVMITGDVNFAETYLRADKIDRNKMPTAPVLTFPENFQTGLSLPIDFSWNEASDGDGEELTYKYYVWPVDMAPNTNEAVLVGNANASGGGNRCAWLLLLIVLLILLLLYFLGLKNNPKLFRWLALAIILVAMLLYYFVCNGKKSKAGKLSHTPTELEAGKAYYWRVIVEDTNGGVTHSETRRFETK